MVTFQLAIQIADIAILLGLISLVVKFREDWRESCKRVNVLWYDYCLQHRIPFTNIGKHVDVLWSVENANGKSKGAGVS